MSIELLNHYVGAVQDSHHARRSETARLLNPMPYHADYFGHKFHCDQNEKLVMFGVTHICGIDSFSGKVVGFVNMPIKNCFEIYAHFFRLVNDASLLV